MKIIGDRARLSATDLANHVACRHLTALDLAVAQDRVAPPGKTAWLPASMQQRGEAHERAYVEYLRGRHNRVVDLRDCRFDDNGFRTTRDTMARGAAVLLQAPLGNERWVGRADVLQRIDRPSALGGWSYEPLDQACARNARLSDPPTVRVCRFPDIVSGRAARTDGGGRTWPSLQCPVVSGGRLLRVLLARSSSARALVIASVKAQRPDISDADLRADVFRRVYASDFTSEDLASIVDRLKTG